MNAILFSMLGCDYVGSDWFNTLRKFQKNRFELSDSFGKRKKRYTSLPLLSYIMFDDLESMTETGRVGINEVLSGCTQDSIFLQDENALSFVDLEHQYWESLSRAFELFNDGEDISHNIESMRSVINDASVIYKRAIDELSVRGEKTALVRLKSASKHLVTWSIAIDVFKSNIMVF